jgi:hypothetical protein
MQAARKIRLLALVALTALLALLVWWTHDQTTRLAHLRAQTNQYLAQAAQLESQKPLIEQRQNLASQRKNLVNQVKAAQIDQRNWGSRSLQLPSSPMSRSAAESTMAQISGANGAQWFVADSFDVQVIQAGEGLFNSPSVQDRGFNLQLAGVIHFPLQKK